MRKEEKYGKDAVVLWRDRKRTFCGLPWSFTRYRLVKHKENKWCKIYSDVGFWSTRIDEINLYRIRDIALKQTFFDKMFGTGTVTLFSNDVAAPVFKLRHVADPYKVRSMLSIMVEEQRDLHGVKVTEFQG